MKVSPNPHYTLTALYGKILRALAKMPQDAAYRKYTEQIVNDRLKSVQNVSWKKSKGKYGFSSEMFILIIHVGTLPYYEHLINMLFISF